MTRELYVDTYEASYPAVVADRFEADATRVERYGWYPVQQSWRDGVLHVVYARRPLTAKDPASVATGRARRWGGALGYTIAALAVAASLAMTFLGRTS